MKTYLKLTVTKHDGQILTFACTVGSNVIPILAQCNKSVLVEESVIHEDTYLKLNWITLSQLT